MRNCPYIPETRREFIREKRRHIKVAKKALSELRSGCAIRAAFGGDEFGKAVNQMEESIDKMDEITKPLS